MGFYGSLWGSMGFYGVSMGQVSKAAAELLSYCDMGGYGVSKAAAELLSYCEAHAGEDPLLAPVPTAENPFRDKKLFCALL
uniref:Guanine nucleotide-binding protein subunit gamma n=1 Tax=Coturnix japonica TaxID=93934 RepID=A0A8C2SMM9_COTJA